MKNVSKKQKIAMLLCLMTLASVSVYSLSTKELSLKGANDGKYYTNTVTNERPKIDVVFVLDTTASMGGMINTAKEKIWSIASTLASANTTPNLRIGFVAYRDRGDAYVTQRIALSDDLDSAYAQLMDFEAEGGGDGPESVNQGLSVAINTMSWSQEATAYMAIFLIGDAPPHKDYDDELSYSAILKQAQERGILINSILCGDDPEAARDWQLIAQLGGGKHFRVKHNGGAIGIITPFDERIAQLSAELDETRMYYGDHSEKRIYDAKVAASDKLKSLASPAALARRGLFNSSVGGAFNFVGKHDLIADLESTNVTLDSIDEAQLPDQLAAISKNERLIVLKETGERRQGLKKKIQALGVQRSAYVKQELAKHSDTQTSLDRQLWETLRLQTADKGILYSTIEPDY